MRGFGLCSRIERQEQRRMAKEPVPATRYEIESADVEYLRHGAQALQARIYRPKGKGPFPAVVEAHGGAWTSGDRLNNQALDEGVARRGIIVVALDFRMPPDGPYPAGIADMNFGVRWLKARAATLGSRPDLVGGLATSSGAHQLLLNALKPRDPRYAVLPFTGAPPGDASLAYIALCWPIVDPLARYRMAKERGVERLVQAHDSYFLGGEASMEEGNPQRLVERGEKLLLPPAIYIQGTADDNVTPDMAERFVASYRRAGGAVELHKYDGQPHTFIAKDPNSAASLDAIDKIADFIHRRSAIDQPKRAAL
jgi:acetyl esterase